jgi:hypothetical protein
LFQSAVVGKKNVNICWMRAAVAALTSHLPSEVEKVRRSIRQYSFDAPFGSHDHFLPIIDCPDIQIFSSCFTRFPEFVSFFAYESREVQAEG